MGVETEYGIVVPGNPAANPMVASGDVVTAYAASRGIRPARASWDYADEAPLRDARGFDMGRGLGAPEPAHRRRGPHAGQRRAHQRRPPLRRPRAPRVLLAGGDAPRAAVRGTGRGSSSCSRRCTAWPPRRPDVNLYKNNTDGKGASYGTHENYLVARSTPFATIVRHLIPFFVVRQVFCGSGRVGIGVDARTAGLPARSARRLLRGGGRPGDHAASGPSSTRATSRTPTPTATAGSTSSSVTPTMRGRQPAQDGHHLARPRDDRGRRPPGRPLGAHGRCDAPRRCPTTYPAGARSSSPTDDG